MAEYPSHLARERRLADGRAVLVRPIRPEDEPREHEFLDELSGDTRHRRFMRYAFPQSEGLVHFFTQVADDWHHTGIAQLLTGELMRAARQRGFATMEGLVLRDNADMLGFVSALGFAVQDMPEEPGLVRVVKRL